uniref:Reverse transcriptase zinc-binding domain-containing protein n=1 Tax=Cannabis sativa TaxID=3483 RepID=A0A803QEC5_CANSA
MYKARYYPNGNFLSATLGSNPSFIWRSIFEAQSVVRHGARKSIGSGCGVSILNDPWLPDSINPYVETVHPALINQNVVSLLCVDNHSWDVEVINDLFGERDKNLILSIQLSDHSPLDRWSWNLESSGFFSVKSAYRFLQSTQGNWTDLVVTSSWKKLWKLEVPPKVLHFLWRAITGCLPTKVQLTTKHVNVDLFCPFCNNFFETISHVLLECSFSYSCWNLSSLSAVQGFNTDYSSWFFTILDTKPAEISVEAAMLSWNIWNTRNDVFWKNKNRSAAAVVTSARSILHQWNAARVEKSGPLLVPSSHTGQDLWKKPGLNTIKVNVDGAIFVEDNKYGFGCVARGADGNLIEAISSSRLGAA